MPVLGECANEYLALLRSLIMDVNWKLYLTQKHFVQRVADLISSVSLYSIVFRIRYTSGDTLGEVPDAHTNKVFFTNMHKQK